MKRRIYMYYHKRTTSFVWSEHSMKCSIRSFCSESEKKDLYGAIKIQDFNSVKQAHTNKYCHSTFRLQLTRRGQSWSSATYVPLSKPQVLNSSFPSPLRSHGNYGNYSSTRRPKSSDQSEVIVAVAWRAAAFYRWPESRLGSRIIWAEN